QPTASETITGTSTPSTDPLFFYLLKGPDLSMGDMTIDRFTGRLSWTPAAAIADQLVLIEVTDGKGAIDTQEFHLAVTAPVVGGNHNPQINWTPQTTHLLVGDKFDEVVTASDIDHDPLTFDLPVHPPGMGIDATTGEIVWKPTIGDVGTRSYIVRVSDGQNGSTYKSYSITVTTPNLAPVI